MYPRWAELETARGVISAETIPFLHLREVAPGLHVGGGAAVTLRSDWCLVIDFDGLSQDPDNAGAYPRTAVLHALPMEDGNPFPPGNLDRVEALYLEHLGQGPILFHCAMGASRSASAAYAILRKVVGLEHGEALRRVQIPSLCGYPMKHTLQSAVRWATR